MSKLSLGGVVLLLMGGCTDEFSTDHIRGDRYDGEVESARLADGVTEVEPSDLRVEFMTCGSDQCAEVDFDGELNVLGIVVSGSSPQTVEGVLIDGRDLVFQTVVNSITLQVDGTFSTSRTTLDVSVFYLFLTEPVFLGAILLTREEPDPEETDTADTGDSGDTGF